MGNGRQTVSASDGEEVKARPVRVMSVAEPRYLTLCKRPANQTSFKVVRSDDSNAAQDVVGGQAADCTPKASGTQAGRVRRVRGVKRSALLRLRYPPGTDLAVVEKDAEDVGLSGYTITEEEDGSILLTRSDVGEIPKDVFTIGIGNGRTACIQRTSKSDIAVARSEEPTGLSVVAFEFLKEKYADGSSAIGYCKEAGITCVSDTSPVVDSGEVIKVVCRDVGDDIEVRSIIIAEGVTALVQRDDAVQSGIPADLMSQMLNVSYGSWGWGHIDFNASVSDLWFCKESTEAIDTLEDVLRNILFYNSLPVSVKRQLMLVAIDQFSQYMVSVLDALPSLISLNVIRNSMEEVSMSVKKDVTTPTSGDSAAVSGDDRLVVTRSDLSEIVSAAVASAIEKQRTTVSTSDVANDAPKEGEKPSPDAQEPQAIALQVEEVVKRAIAPLGATITLLEQRVQTVEGSTILRSDQADGNKKSDIDPPASIFANLLHFGK